MQDVIRESGLSAGAIYNYFASKDDIIIATTIEMGHALGLTVVAEGIETSEQAAHVKKLGCDLAQGYYFAMPLPASQIPPES